MDIIYKAKNNQATSSSAEKLGNKENFKRASWFSLGRVIRWDVLGKLKVERVEERVRRMGTWGIKMDKLWLGWSRRVCRRYLDRVGHCGVREKAGNNESPGNPKGQPLLIFQELRGSLNLPSSVIRLVAALAVIIDPSSVIRLVTILAVIIEPSFSTWWKQIQSSTAKHLARLWEPKWKEGRETVWERQTQDCDGETSRDSWHEHVCHEL